MTRIGLTIHIEDPKEAPGVDYAYVEDTEAEETTIADIATTGHPVESNAIFNMGIVCTPQRKF